MSISTANAIKLSLLSAIAANPANAPGPIPLDEPLFRVALACPAFMADCPDLIGNASVSADSDYWWKVKYNAVPVRYQFPDGSIITILPCFPTDGASIPAIVAAETYSPFDDKVIWGADLHDLLTETNGVPFDVAAHWLQMLWEWRGVPHLLADVMRLAMMDTVGQKIYSDCQEGSDWYLQFVEVTPGVASLPEIQTARDVADADNVPLVKA